jgi:hypothetical protein
MIMLILCVVCVGFSIQSFTTNVEMKEGNTLNGDNYQNIGLGCFQLNPNFNYQSSITVYIANKPSMPEYAACDSVKPMRQGEIATIGLTCGNGWRKVFNVYSKLLYALDPNKFSFQSVAPKWQTYRDDFLLQQGSATTLLFSAPLLNKASDCIHIISGKTYAKDLINSGVIKVSLIWLDEHFAIDVSNKLIVCPYFDYRQLSNQKIERLGLLINELIKSESKI